VTKSDQLHFIAKETPIPCIIYSLYEIIKADTSLTNLWEQDGCTCHLCEDLAKKLASVEQCLPLVDFSSIIWPLLLQFPISIIPSSKRLDYFNVLLGKTATPDRWVPEFVFNTLQEQSVGLRSSGEAPVGMFDQLAQSLHVTPEAHLRGKIGEVTWKARFKGITNRGMEGLPGPYRMSLTQVCADLRANCGKSGLFLQSPNLINETGLDRNKLILNNGSVSLDSCKRFGQLLGVALRSQDVIDIDIADIFFKQLQNQFLDEDELASVDFSSWQSLQFTNGERLVDEEEFKDVYDDLTWSCRLSDGSTVQLRGTEGNSVGFQERWEYARVVTEMRLNESIHVVDAIRHGLHSIVPACALKLLTWQELQLRLCGESVIDLQRLRSKTEYTPWRYNERSTIVNNFWSVLGDFTQEQLDMFLQFAWARSRLPPPDTDGQGWRLRVNILEAATQEELPTAETCFFNVNLPKYSTRERLAQKLLTAVTYCSSITS